MKRLQFSLQGLLLLILTIAIFLGAITYHLKTVRDFRKQLTHAYEVERVAKINADKTHKNAQLARKQEEEVRRILERNQHSP